MGNLIITYINEYMSKDYNSKSLAIRLRELLKGVKNGIVLEDTFYHEIEHAYNHIMMGENEYVSL